MSNLAPAAAVRPARPTPARPFAASVVVPTLNEEKTLAALLGPLRAAAGALGLELVVSDGGSTDTTLTLAAKLADQVAVHEGPGRQTIAAGRNAGARLASADVLLFFNADVRLPEPVAPFLADLIASAQQHGAATCRVVVHPDEATLADRLVLSGCNAVFWAWNRVGRGMGRGECHAIRRDLFEAVGGYREHLTAGED
ncbi:MAG TPA: glycosyltransferase, partial [Rubricoccaceae bacterium]|nr:glycosyltransferase [Rubricoccaceae bacterium]